MSKITNVRLPNAVAANYSPEQLNQIVRSIEQIVLQLNTNYSSNLGENISGASSWFSAGGASSGFSGAVSGFQNSVGMLQPYAMLMSDQDQTNPSITGENLVTYNQVVLRNGVTVTDGSRIRVPSAGQYLITVSLQVTNRGNTAAEFELWAKAGGNNYPLSNTRFDIPVRKSSTIWSHTVAAVSGIFTVENAATDYLEMAWWSDSLDVYLEHYGTNTSPTRPAIPSVIVTVNFISALGGQCG